MRRIKNFILLKARFFNRLYFRVSDLLFTGLTLFIKDDRLSDFIKFRIWPHKIVNQANCDVSKLMALKGIASGKRCFIFGTAPSVTKLNLSLLTSNDDFVFLVNKAYLLYDGFGKKPDAYLISDPKAYEEYGEELDPNKFDYFFISHLIKSGLHDIQSNKLIQFNFWDSPRVYDGFFQKDIVDPLYHAHTVVIYCIQIAVYMGFKDIVLCGVDLDFNKKEPHFYRSSARENKWSKEISHKKSKRMYKGFEKIGKICRSMNIGIYTMSDNKNFDMYERKAWEDFF